MTYLFNKYCKPTGRKAYAVGVSMGANILGNLLGFTGKNCFLDGAFCV